MWLTCNFTLSKTIQGLEGTVEKLVEKANRELFLRGVPPNQRENAARITGWKITERTLRVNVTSGTFVRAPSAILRFRKVLAEEVGRKFKAGIRGVELLNFKIELTVGEATEEAVQKIRDLTYVQDVAFHDGKLTILLNPVTEAELRRNVSDRVLALVRSIIQERGEAAGIAVPVSILKQGRPREVKFRGDPARVGLELGWIKDFPGRGQWVYTTPYAMLLNTVEDIVVKEVLEKLGFEPFMLPKLIPLEVMRRMPGYLEDIPEGMYYVCPPPRDPEAFTKFKEAVKVRKEVSRKMLKEIIKEPEYVLSPAQCEPFWYFFSHETLRVEDLPIKLYDRSGWTYRWEGGGVEGLARIQEFRRIELGYLGTPEQVVEIRDAVRDNAVRVVEDILDLEWRVVAATPFYMRGGEVGDVEESRKIAAYDIEVYVPYRGDRKDAEWLEIAGCFIHKDKFVDSFSIHEAKGRPIWTGCCGLGISRWVTAFLATHGFKPDDWPSRVRERFGSYKLPKTLLWPKKTLQDP